jgi:vacuolar-type H+-ATPase subunit I/STV1
LKLPVSEIVVDSLRKGSTDIHSSQPLTIATLNRFTSIISQKWKEISKDHVRDGKIYSLQSEISLLTLPPAAKQQKILDYFRESMSVYTIKELEKNLPPVASINGMQVKEYLQALQDEYLIRVEKIGSGNYYWCFMSDAKRIKENALNNLQAEENKLTSSIAETERLIEEEIAKREEDDEKLEDGSMERKTLLEAHDALMKEMESLDKELACYSDNDPADVLRKVEGTKRLKDSTIRWTDNIESLESLLINLTGDRAQVAELMRSACGDEYVVGEGLKDL